MQSLTSKRKIGFSDISGSFPVSCVAEFEFDAAAPSMIKIHVHGTGASNHDQYYEYAVPRDLLRDGLDQLVSWADIKIWPAAQHPTKSHPVPMQVVRLTLGHTDGSEKRFQISHRLLSDWVLATYGDSTEIPTSTVVPGRLAPGGTPAPAQQGNSSLGDSLKVDTEEEKGDADQIAQIFLPGEVDGVTFDQVIGQEVAKKEAREPVFMLQHPERFAAVEAEVPTGLLFSGPPGTGKTMLARAMGAETGLPILVTNGAAFVERYVGVGAARMRAVFGKANQLTEEYGGCLVVIDEMDVLGKARGSGNDNSEQEQTLNAFLVELDGFVGRPGVLVIGLTNRPDMLDEALVRPGRFDRKVTFRSPTRKIRQQILELYLPEHLRAADVKLQHIARLTPGASGAYLKNLCNEAKIAAGFADSAVITQQMLNVAEQKVAFGARDDDFVLTDKELLDTAVHEGGHLIAGAFGTDKAPGKIPQRFSNIPQGNMLGHVMTDEEEKSSRTYDELMARMVVGVAGKVAVEMLCDGQQDTGPSSDLSNVTRLARMMVCDLGMSPAIGNVSLSELAKSGVKIPDMLVFTEIKRLTDEATKLAEALLEEHKEALRAVVDAVMVEEELLGEQIAELLKPFGGGEFAVEE